MERFSEIVGKREIHSLLENDDKVDQQFCFFSGQLAFMLRLVEKIDGFCDFKNVPLVDCADQLGFLAQKHDLFAI